MMINYSWIIFLILIYGLSQIFYKYSALDIPLTFITDDILRTMAMSQKHYFKLNKSKSLDGRDHYFVFSIQDEQRQ